MVVHSRVDRQLPFVARAVRVWSGRIRERDKGKVKSFPKEEERRRKRRRRRKEGKRRTARGARRAAGRVLIVTKNDGFWSRLPGRHSATHSSLPSLSNGHPVASGSGTTAMRRSLDTLYIVFHCVNPDEYHQLESNNPGESVPSSTTTFPVTPHPRIPSSSHSYRISDRKLDRRRREDEDDDFDGYHAPVQKRSHAEIYASLPPIHHEQARNLIRSNHLRSQRFATKVPENLPPKGW
jgi:hypothetical protein